MKILHNAVVYTGDNFTHSFALEDGRFVAVGDEALALKGERIDLNGSFVCAGFNDSHMHLLNYGQALSMAPLAAHTGSLEDMVDCLKNARPDRGWILGRGWNQDYFSDVRRMPSRRDLDRVSSDFARRIEALQLLPTVVDFMLEMMRTYCRLVRRHSIKHYSPLIQKVIIQIENDLTCDLSLQTVARQNSVSPGYLSGHFKKETGQTFTAYVNSRRVNLAKHLLRTTSLQVQTIAQHCGILDFHYFCRVFKSCVGKTPTEYRNSYGFD